MVQDGISRCLWKINQGSVTAAESFLESALAMVTVLNVDASVIGHVGESNLKVGHLIDLGCDSLSRKYF